MREKTRVKVTKMVSLWWRIFGVYRWGGPYSTGFALFLYAYGPPYQNRSVKCIKYIGFQKKPVILECSSIQKHWAKSPSPYSVQKKPDSWTNIPKTSNLEIQEVFLIHLWKEIQSGVWLENIITPISTYLKHKKSSITNI